MWVCRLLSLHPLPSFLLIALLWSVPIHVPSTCATHNAEAVHKDWCYLILSGFLTGWAVFICSHPKLTSIFSKRMKWIHFNGRSVASLLVFVLLLSLLSTAVTWWYVKPLCIFWNKRLEIKPEMSLVQMRTNSEGGRREILRRRGGESWLRLLRARTTGSSGWGGQEREGWWGRDSYSPFSFVIISGVIAGGAALGGKERRWCWHHPPPRGLRGCVTTFSSIMMHWSASVKRRLLNAGFTPHKNNTRSK